VGGGHRVGGNGTQILRGFFLNSYFDYLYNFFGKP
jgi:hypothetical protein